MTVNDLFYIPYDWLRSRKYIRKEFNHIKDRRFQEISKSFSFTKENKDAVDDFFCSNYGQRIPYDWHKYFSAHSGVFDPRYFPNFLLSAYFEYFININRHYVWAFVDKNVLPYIASSAGVKMPRTILSMTCDVLRDGDSRVINYKQAESILTSSGDVFCKKSKDSYGGKGCFILNFKGSKNPIVEIQNRLGSDFIIQEIVQCHKSIEVIYPRSVNTFRVVTYRWKEGFHQMPVFMRVGQGGAIVDNGASGGMFLGVHSDGSLTGKALMPYNTCILSHPDTGFVFKGHVIEHFPKVCESAIRMHQMIPQVGMVYWDYTIDSEGEPVLIECNVFNGTIYAIQMTLGVPAFGERTAEVLQWIRKMKHVPHSKWVNYAYGYC